MKLAKVVIVMLLAVVLSGCGQPLADFAAGVGTGVAVKLGEANRAMELLDENVEALNEKAAELEVLIEQDPVRIVNAFDPNLGGELAEFLVNIKGLEARAGAFKDDKDRIDWERLLLTAALTAFGGWNGSRLVNKKKDGV